MDAIALHCGNQIAGGVANSAAADGGGASRWCGQNGATMLHTSISLAELGLAGGVKPTVAESERASPGLVEGPSYQKDVGGQGGVGRPEWIAARRRGSRRCGGRDSSQLGGSRNCKLPWPSGSDSCPHAVAY